jgi:adenine-specific DNA-methyltransferase
LKIEDYKLGKIDIYKLCHSFDEANSTEKNGVIYTPEDIAIKVIKESGILKEKTISKLTILEPSMGHGVFVFALLLQLKKRFNKRDILDLLYKRITCVELKKESVKGFFNILEAFLDKEFKVKLDKDKIKNIYNKDFLKYSLTVEENKYDYCIGNPPYIRFQDLGEKQRVYLRENFKSCQSGNPDIFYAFCEEASRISKKMSFIIPNSILRNKSAIEIRNLMKNKIEKIYDYSSVLVFPGVGTYTCIITTSNKSKEITYTEHHKDAQKVSREYLNKSKMWIFKKGETAKNEGVSISKKHILGGLNTNSDKCFIVEKISDNSDGTSVIYSKITKKNEIVETAILHKYLKLTKIKSQKDADNCNLYIIVPYLNNKIIEEETLKNEYPLTYRYFNVETIKEVLLGRDRGNIEKYDSWYAFGRKQGFYNLKNKTVIIIPGIFSAEESPIRIRMKENFFFTNGLLIEDYSYYSFLTASSFKTFAKLEGKPWAGKNNYVSLSKTLLSTFVLSEHKKAA